MGTEEIPTNAGPADSAPALLSEVAIEEPRLPALKLEAPALKLEVRVFEQEYRTIEKVNEWLMRGAPKRVPVSVSVVERREENSLAVYALFANVG